MRNMVSKSTRISLEEMVKVVRIMNYDNIIPISTCIETFLEVMNHSLV